MKRNLSCYLLGKRNILSVLLCLFLGLQICTVKPISLDFLQDFSRDYPVGSKVVYGISGFAGFFALYKLINYMRGHDGQSQENLPKLPIYGGKAYDISFWGIERLHPFDSTKYGKVQSFLENQAGIAFHRITKPRMVTDQELALVHTPQYLESLKSSRKVAEISEVYPLALAPNFLCRRYLLNPMKLATGGTIQAAKDALEHGWAFNLGGGYHHAKSNSGGGFCFYADIPIAVRVLRRLPGNENLRVLIIDLDAHQGNGHEAVLGPDDKVQIFDMYNAQAYPRDNDNTARYIDFKVDIQSRTRDRNKIAGPEYIRILRLRLEAALNELRDTNRQPDLIIFNAGTDPLDGDPLGAMGVSEEHMIERDQIVFEQAKRRRIPTVYLTSGGYTSASAGLIGRSIKNILENVIQIDLQGDTVTPLFARR